MSWVSQAKEFRREVVAEVKKVTFPSRDEVIGTTVVVLIASFIMAIYLWLADLIILRVYEFTLGIFS